MQKEGVFYLERRLKAKKMIGLLRILGTVCTCRICSVEDMRFAVIDIDDDDWR